MFQLLSDKSYEKRFKHAFCVLCILDIIQMKSAVKQINGKKKKKNYKKGFFSTGHKYCSPHNEAISMLLKLSLSVRS